MQYQIDQSGRVEYSSVLTIVAYTNGHVKALKISATEKQKLIKIMRIRDFPKKTFVFKIFAGLIYALIKGEQINSLIIDEEYPGQRGIIKDVLARLFKRENDQIIPNVQFAHIGKKSAAHKAALDTFQGKRKPDMIVKADDILQLFY